MSYLRHQQLKVNRKIHSQYDFDFTQQKIFAHKNYPSGKINTAVIGNNEEVRDKIESSYQKRRKVHTHHATLTYL